MTSQKQIETVLLPAFKYSRAITVTKRDGQVQSGYMMHDLDHDGFSLTSGPYCFWTDIVDAKFCEETLKVVEWTVPSEDPFGKGSEL